MLNDLDIPAIRVAGLSKVYRGGKRALDGISLSIPKGSFFALLGPNGAGKSTFINILAGLVVKSAGSAEIWGHDIDRAPREARSSIGVVPQELNIDPFFTPRQALEFHAGLYGVPKPERRTDEILAALGLSDKAEAYARTLSGGMRRRLLVAKALVHAPPVLVLDEPTAGVDVELRQQLWSYIKGLNERGVTVILTTHYLEEAETLCDRIAIIAKGKLVAADEKAALLARIDAKEMVLQLAAPLSAIPAGLERFRPRLESGGHSLHVHYRPSEAGAGQIIALVQAAGVAINDLSTRESDLEDVFLQLTRSDGAEPVKR